MNITGVILEFSHIYHFSHIYQVFIINKYWVHKLTITSAEN